MRLHLVVATLEWPGYRECVDSLYETAETEHLTQIIFGRTIIDAYNQGAKFNAADIVVFAHDDLMMYEKGWDKRVLKEFEDEQVAMVGIAGGLGHGHPQMYKIPYELPQLARRGFRSNLVDAEAHGERFAGECDVTVLDGMFLAFRRKFLKQTKYWPTDGTIGYYLYAEYMCCMARRLGYKIRLVGVNAHHLSGRSTGIKDQMFDFEGEHKFLYEHFRDVFPAEAK